MPSAGNFVQSNNEPQPAAICTRAKNCKITSQCFILHMAYNTMYINR